MRDKFCYAAGEKVMDLIAKQDPAARYRHPQGARECRRRCGGYPAARPMRRLHLPAIAHECGIEFDLFDVAEIFKRRPTSLI
jgi:dihydroxy-acid dehydratase